MNHRLVIEGRTERRHSFHGYSILLDGKRIWVRWKSFNYLYLLATYDMAVLGHWVNREKLEAQTENVPRYIYHLRKEVDWFGIIESDRNCHYRINPDCEISITKRADDLIAKG